jgi:PKD repeat protein
MMLRKNYIFAILFVLANTFNIFAQTANVTQGCAPLTVQFTNKAGVAKPFWNFKDGVTSELLNPSNIFTKPGVYVVELRENSATGAIAGTITINVYAQPIVGFKGVPLSGCTPLTVPFSTDIKKDVAITITGYQWTFGDGGNSNTENPSHTYIVGGKFSVGLTIKTNFPSCDASGNFKDTVKATAAPLVVFNVNPGLTSCTAPFNNVNFINASQPKTGITFAWDFGNGNKFSGEDAPAQNFTKVGNYTVSLTGTAANGCKSTYSALVSVGNPRASFRFPNDTLCIDGSYTPKNLSAFGNYQWTFGSGALFTDPTLAEPTVKWQTPGFKTVKLSVVESSGLCKNDTTVTIFIEDKVSPFKTTSSPVCQTPVNVTYETLRPYASYSWLFSTQDKAKSNLAKPTIQWKNTDPSGYSQVGPFLAYSNLTTVSFAGCEGSFFDIDTFNFVNARVVPNKWQGCVPLTVEFADSSYSKEPFDTFTFLWGDGSAPEVFNAKATQTHTFTKAGEYKVRMVLKNKAGCIDTSHVVLIEVGETLNPDFGVNKTTVCPGDTVKFKNLSNNPKIDAWHYSTDNDRSSHCYGEPNPSWIFTNTGAQSVTLTVGYNGCFSSITKKDFITVKGPIAKIDYLVPCAPKNRDVEFKSLSQDVTSVTWDFGDTTNSSAANLTHTYKKSGDYKVKLKAENSTSGCPASIDSVIVYVRDLNADFDILKQPLGVPAGFQLCLGQEYKLQAKSTDVHSTCNSGYTWHFSDPNDRPVTTQDDNIKFIPKMKGDYKVMLVVKDINGCLDTMISPRRVFGVYPKVGVNPKEICIPKDVTFNGTGTTSDTTIKEWKWTFGDTATEDNTVGTVVHKYTLPPLGGGNKYLIKLELMDVVGCSGTIIDSVKFYKPESFITAKTPICLGDTITISASDFIEKGNKLTYNWSIDGTSAGTAQTFKRSFSTDGDKEIKLNYRETNTNCPGTTTLKVQVQTKPTVDFILPISLCAPATLEFKDTTISKYQPLKYSWDFGNGQGSNEKDGVVFYDKKGDYKVTLFAETTAGCKASTEKTVSLKEKPKGDFTMSKNSICFGESITFTLKDTAKVGSFQWFFGDGADLVGQNPATHAYTSRNFNPQTVTKAVLRLIPIGGGCEATAEKDITINNVIADFEILNNGVCALKPILFKNTSKNTSKYSWVFEGGTPTINTADTVQYTFDYKKGNTFNVKLIAENATNGCKNEIEKNISVITPEVGANIQPPSIFEPDGQIPDNKVFIHYAASVDATKCIAEKEVDYFEIFDRWGRKVYTSKKADGKIVPWNGDNQNDGAALATDVYVYIFYFVDKSQPLVGNVTLVR